MEDSLESFLKRRHAELDAQIGVRQAAIDHDRAEMAQLCKAAEAAGINLEEDALSETRALNLNEAARALEHTAESKVRGPKRASEATIKDAVIQVLGEEERLRANRALTQARTVFSANTFVEKRGLTAVEILPKVNEMLGIDYPRTSLSPQLSRLKSDGVLELDGNIWSLARNRFGARKVKGGNPETSKGPDADASEPPNEIGLGGPQQA